MRDMAYQRASKFVMPSIFRHRSKVCFNGMTIDEIASSDDGLRTLDWLSDQLWVSGDLSDALAVYLSDQSIQREVALLLGS